MREGLGKRPGSYTEAPGRSDATDVFEQFKTSVEFAKIWSPWTSVDLAGSIRMEGGMYPERP